jgi:putative SOS response-associated peptidase YedK
MCTRFVLEGPGARIGFKKLGLEALAAALDAALDRFNIGPGAELVALRAGEAAGTARAFRTRWGWPAPPAGEVPGAGSLLVNARAETLAVRPRFRDAYRLRRCLVPATGFYEWEKRGRARLPWLFRRADGAPFVFAALWTPADHEDREAGPTARSAVAIVTTAANRLVEPLHDRMPVIFTEAGACRAWLDTGAAEAAVADLLRPGPEASWTATPVSPRMNRITVDDPACVRPAVHGVAARDQGEGAELPGL